LREKGGKGNAGIYLLRSKQAPDIKKGKIKISFVICYFLIIWLYLSPCNKEESQVNN